MALHSKRMGPVCFLSVGLVRSCSDAPLERTQKREGGVLFTSLSCSFVCFDGPGVGGGGLVVCDCCTMYGYSMYGRWRASEGSE